MKNVYDILYIINLMKRRKQSNSDVCQLNGQINRRGFSKVIKEVTQMREIDSPVKHASCTNPKLRFNDD